MTPDQWVTGAEPMTRSRGILPTNACQEANMKFDESPTKAEASQKIDDLQNLTGHAPRSKRRVSDRKDHERADGGVEE
jgi:hypothetical protein